MAEGRIAAQKLSSATSDALPYTMRVKQLVAQVRQGRRVVFDILDEGTFSGYLAGWDADTYLLLIPVDSDGDFSFQKLLIPDHHVLFIQLIDERTFRDEPLFREMDAIVGPFRDSLNNSYPK